MKRIIEHFDQTYIINLAERADRRKEVVDEFSRIGINIPNEKVRFLTRLVPAYSAGDGKLFVDSNSGR
jgi:hypothetical protein